MKKMLMPLALLFSTAAFSQQAPLEENAYDNIHHEYHLKPSTNIPNQTRFALIDNNDKTNRNKDYGLTPKYWLTLSHQYLKSIDPWPTERASFRKADYTYGLFLLHTPAIKKNSADLLFPY